MSTAVQPSGVPGLVVLAAPGVSMATGAVRPLESVRRIASSWDALPGSRFRIVTSAPGTGSRAFAV